jgi:hypothetical protein
LDLFGQPLALLSVYVVVADGSTVIVLYVPLSSVVVVKSTGTGTPLLTAVQVKAERGVEEAPATVTVLVPSGQKSNI